MRAANARLRSGNSAVPPASADAEAAEQGPPARPRGQLVHVEEEVLRDLSHELGNYFHKLYYWTDFIKADSDDVASDGSPVHMLDRTIHNLEQFLKIALEYFEPTVLRCIAMSGAELAKAIESALRAENDDVHVEVSGQGTDDARLMLDPNRFSQALRLVARQLRGAAGAGPGALGWQAKLRRVRNRDVEQIEIEITAPSSLGEATPRRGLQMVEWAVAGRMVEMHGGALSSREQRLGAAGCSLTIPLAS